jgi:hypothetical protein
MTSPADICNQALALLGTRSTITDLNEDSNEARACLQFYDSTRRQTIRSAPWGIAKKFQTLTLWKSAPGTPEFVGTPTPYWTDAYPAPGWNYSYLYPDDCLWMRFIIPQIDVSVLGVPLFSTNTSFAPSFGAQSYVKYSIATDADNGNQIKVILTNQRQAIACYNRDVEDPNLWDPGFEEAIVSALAAQLAMPLTGDKQLMQLNFQIANKRIMDARASDNNESPVVHEIIPDFILARGGGFAAQGVFGQGISWGPLWNVPV